MSTWSVTKWFRVLNGDFNREAQSALTKRSVRLLPEPACYVYTARIEAESKATARIKGDSQLMSIIAPYGVQAHVYDSDAVELVE